MTGRELLAHLNELDDDDLDLTVVTNVAANTAAGCGVSLTSVAPGGLLGAGGTAALLVVGLDASIVGRRHG